MRDKKLTRISLCILSVLLCASFALPAAATTADSRQSTRSATGSGKYDAHIQQEVTKRFSNKKEFHNVTPTVEDGVVTLSGTVDRYHDKVRAEKKAHEPDHVQWVRNLIEVRGQNVTDAVLREKLANKLRYDRIGQGIVFNALSLNVQKGVVTVSGTVRDEPDRASALAIIETQPGVKGVNDEINVAPVSPFDDDLRIQLARAIYGDSTLQRYANDPQAPIRIVVQHGHVTLAGVVDSAMDKQIAGMRANQVPGVFSVDNKLMVAGAGNH